jgi:hypothetical protein
MRLWIPPVVISLAILYLVSFGPACWLNQRTGIGGPAIAIAYMPIGWLYAHSNESTHNLIRALASFGAESDRQLGGWSDDGPVWSLRMPYYYDSADEP